MKQHSWVWALAIISISMGLVGCGGAQEQDPLVGSWTFSEYLSSQEIAEMSEEEMPEGFNMSMSLSGTVNYAEDGSRESNGAISMDMMVMGESISFNMNFTESGTWERKEDDEGLLVEHIVSAEFGSDDQETDMMLNQTPELRDSMGSLVGESTESRILSVSANQIVMEDLESGMEVTLTRVQ